MLTVVTIDTPELGDRSYLVHDGEVALVVDPQRDIERITSVADAAGVRITHVAETHIHDDYVSGGLALASRAGAFYLLSSAEDVSFEHVGVAAGDVISTGELTVAVAATPGHTPTHLSYVVSNGAAPAVVFTGGSLLHGAVGRPDLSDPDPFETRRMSATQLASVRRLAEIVGADSLVYPTHGFGGYCASAPRPAVRTRTVAEEQADNPAFSGDDDATLIERMVGGIVEPPPYYSRVSLINRLGAGPSCVSAPRQMTRSELFGRVANEDEYVIDIRVRRAFAKSHLYGSVSFEHHAAFAMFVGSVIPPEATISLLGESAAQVGRAVVDLARLGIDEIAGAAIGAPEQLSGADGISSIEVSDFTGLAKAMIEEDLVVLDVRRGEEWRAGHLDGATHLYLADLPQRIDDVPPGPVWVHCSTGCRASIATSLLERSGRSVVLVDDDWPNARQAGFDIVRSY